MAVAHKLSTFAFFTETQILDEPHDCNRKRVIGHQDIDLGWRHTGLAKGDRSGLGPGTDRNVAAVFTVLGRLARTDNPHRLLTAIARHSRRRDDHRTTAIGDHTALEQP